MRRLVGISAALLLLPAASAAAAEHTVSVGNDFFSPANVQIAVGDTVNWVFSEAGNHNIRSRPGQAESFNSDPGVPLAAVFHPAGYRFSHTFTKDAVEVDYLCEIHPSTMKGTVTVGVPAPDTTPPGLDARKSRVGRNAVKVRFELGEAGLVELKVARARRPGRALRTIRRRLEAGAHALTVGRGGLSPGRYVAKLTATDEDGNKSGVSTARFRLKPRR